MGPPEAKDNAAAGIDIVRVKSKLFTVVSRVVIRELLSSTAVSTAVKFAFTSPALAVVPLVKVLGMVKLPAHTGDQVKVRRNIAITFE
jgi:hypothetical protein